MPLITRQGKGSKLTIQEMDGNLEYLQTNLSGSNTIIGNTDIKTTADSDAILKIFSTSSVTTQDNRGDIVTITTTQEQIKSDFVTTIDTSEFTSSFKHINLVSVASSSFGEFTAKSLGIGYILASSSYDGGKLGDPLTINKFIGGQVGGPDGGFYSDTTTIIPIGQDNEFSINISTNSYNSNFDTANSGSIVLKKTNNDFMSPKDTILYIDGNQPGVNIYSTEEQSLNIYGAADPSVIGSTPPTLFQVNQSGSISIPQTASAEPTWTGSDGEIVPATVGGSYYLYMWMNGAWRSGSFS